MKKILYGMMAATMIFATSCENELEVGAAGEESVVSFTIATPDMGSRAYSDGATATVLQYAVYEGETELTDLTKSVVKGNAETINGSTTVNLKLTTGNTYSVIFWAAAPNAPYTVDFANKTMKVNYEGAVSNDESRDAFYAKETFTVTGAQTETIELKRPFAQLNIGTNDYAASASAGYTPTKSKVVVSNVYGKLDLWEGEVDSSVVATFDFAAIDTTELFPVSGFKYLAMNYALVSKDKETVEVAFSYKEATGEAKTRKVGSVPVQRNYRTNIYGELLTSEVGVKVEIEPEYEETDNNVGVPYVTIGDEIYESFAAAFAAAQDGETLVLQGESVLKATANQNLFKVEKNITIDLNGNALVGQIPNVTKNTAVFEVIEGGSLTIQGEGDVRVVTAKAPNVLAAMINNNGGVVNLKGGNWTMVALEYPDALIPTFVDNNSNVNDATLNIYGGTYTFHRNLFRNFANAASHNGYATVATINIYGGTFNGRPDDAGAIWNQKPSASTPAGAGVINVMGGTFNNVVIEDDFDGIATVNDATELANALNDSSVKVIQLGAGEYVLPSSAKGKTITFVGSANAEDVKVAVTKIGAGGENCDYALDGSNVTFVNITITTNSSTYIGYARCNGTYKNCIINGTYTLYGKSVFENCTFNVSGDKYNIWTWGAPEATFTDCTFNCDGKSLLLYGQANTKLTVNNCTFNDNGTISGKAAIEIGNDYDKSYELIVNNTTVNGFDINPNGFVTGTTLWANKNSMPADKLKVTVDGKDAYTIVVYDVDGLKNMLNNPNATFIELGNDITGDVVITQKEGINVTLFGNGKKFNGVMTVFGNGNQNGSETLTIKGINFVAKDGADACIVSPDRTVNNKYSYAHNVTVENCTFADTDGTVNCAAIRHEDGGDKNWTVKGCTVSRGMHSILQVNNVEGSLVVEDCEVYSKNGANLNSTTNVAMNNCEFDVNGYAVRFGVSSGGNLGTPKNYAISNSTLKSANGDGDAVIIFRASAVDATLTLTNTTLVGDPEISGATSDTEIIIN